MSTAMEPSPELTRQLPIFQMRDFDILLNQSWPLGVDSGYPSELRVRLSAASLSFSMGNKSIDHFRKHYLNDLSYPVSPQDRLDKKIAHSLKDGLQKLHEVLSNLEPPAPKLGHMVSKWTFMRIPFSFDLALTCAQRGALFECLAIVRMILEQIAWALEVRSWDDFDAITTRQAQQSLRSLKSVHFAAGNFYGWLSNHAHWTYDAHIKAFHHSPGQIGMRLADPLYKGQALGALLVMFEIVHAAYHCLFESLGQTNATHVFKTTETSSFVHDLQRLAPEDSDIRRLNDMLTSRDP
jgi:hypothetical protein